MPRNNPHTRRLVAISDEAHAALVQLFNELGWTGQRGEAFSPGIEQLGQVAIGAMPELIAALTIAHQCSIGGDWDELTEAICPEWMDSPQATAEGMPRGGRNETF